MTIKSQLLPSSALPSIWWLMVTAALCTPVCRADLIVGNAQPMNQTISEHFPFGSVVFTIVNTGIAPISTISYIAKESPRFGPLDSGDIAYDAVQPLGTDLVCVFPSGAQRPLQAVLLNRDEFCTTNIQFAVLDHDPFDELNPVDDFADWAILLQVTAVDALTGAPVNDEIGHAYVRVVDEPVPEPATAALVSSGLLTVSLLYKRGRARYPLH